MKIRTAFFSNHYFLLDNNGKIIGAKCGDKCIMLGDRVRVKGDCYGYIGPGITEEGLGTVVDFNDRDTDHYFGVMMDNGECGYLNHNRITKVILPSPNEKTLYVEIEVFLK